MINDNFMRSAFLEKKTLSWIAIIIITIIFLIFKEEWSWSTKYPKELIVPISDWINFLMEKFVNKFGWFFLNISWVLSWPINAAQWLLHSLPWVVIIFLVTFTAYLSAGLKLALFTLCSAFYMVLIGYWDESMNTLSLVIISVPMAVSIGFGLGVWGHFSKRAEKIIMPILDIFQTVPTFAYLLPILLLFGFGTVVGLIASVLYSFPPMVRNTILGLKRVPANIIESAIMSGADPKQLFWQAMLPSCKKQILLGVNQSTMAALSMVIIAAIIGGTADIGWEVLYYIRKAEVGQSLVVGMVIALMAIIIDRITTGFALKSDQDKKLPAFQKITKISYLSFAFIGSVSLFIFAMFFEILDAWPYNLSVWLAGHINHLFDAFVETFRAEIKQIKNYSLFFIMLPTKIGLQQAVSPFTWGFQLETVHKILYFSSCLVLSLWLLKKKKNEAFVFTLLFMIFIYTGLTQMPWPPLLIIYSFFAWQIGGYKLALGTFIGLGFIIIVGMWPEAMLSVYLCGIAVVFCFIMGTSLGIWAAHNSIVSAIVRPINDTLQTIPLFVILIPFVMLFKIGDFTALLAIIIYAIVPSVRYAEHGIRNLSSEVIEASKMMGSTKMQLLFFVKIPLAMPVIMLGLNQTIMYGIAMLVIAALIGTNGLEQIVFIGLTDGNMGKGLIAGISLAIIAMIADQMTASWSVKLQERYTSNPAD
jgi:glycine betaine/proline transport system permease protein